MSLSARIKTVVEGQSLTQDEAYSAACELMEGSATHTQIAALLTALKIKGETASEITGFSLAMRERVIKVIGELPQRAYLDLARALADWCALERVDLLRAPMLMLAAEHDYTPLDEKRSFAQRVGAQLAVVSGSRHGTPFDAIHACNACALAWFQGRELPPPEILCMDTAALAPSAPPAGFTERELALVAQPGLPSTREAEA